MFLANLSLKRGENTNMYRVDFNKQPYKSGLNYAEGYLSAGHSRWGAAWNGARYAGFTTLNRIVVAKAIFKNLKVRGLKPGMELAKCAGEER